MRLTSGPARCAGRLAKEVAGKEEVEVAEANQARLIPAQGLGFQGLQASVKLSGGRNQRKASAREEMATWR